VKLDERHDILPWAGSVPSRVRRESEIPVVIANGIMRRPRALDGRIQVLRIVQYDKQFATPLRALSIDGHLSGEFCDRTRPFELLMQLILSFEPLLGGLNSAIAASNGQTD